MRDEDDRRGTQRHIDRAVAALAGRQQGQISTAQLRAMGMTARQIRVRVESGRLHPGPRGVYAVGVPAASDEATAMAATLAVKESVLGVRSAANLWEVWRNVRSRECVIAPRRARDRPDVDVRTMRLDPRDVTRLRGIPVTTPARTLLDLAAELSPTQLHDALATARVRRLVSDDDLRDVLARHPRHRGTRRLGDALTGPFTRSRLERRFLELVAGERDLPRPRVNERIGPDECDLVWPECRLVVELDGPHHAGDWARDADRQRRLEAAGWRVLRLTWWDVERDWARTLARLRAALA